MKIALLAGDGIGPEILREAVRVLDVLRERGLHDRDRGSARRRRGVRRAQAIRCPKPRSSSSKQSDAVLFGAVGGPQYDKLAARQAPERAILGLRKECDFFANLRPADGFPGARRRVDAEAGSRERPRHHDRARAHRRHLLRPAARRERRRRRDRVGINTMHYTEAQIRRILHVGFKTARARGKRLLSVDKMNVLETTAALARHRRRDRAGVPGCRSFRICSWITAPCSWCATRGNST